MNPLHYQDERYIPYTNFSPQTATEDYGSKNRLEQLAHVRVHMLDLKFLGNCVPDPGLLFTDQGHAQSQSLGQFASGS
jgi:hypothetical protein